MTHLRRLILVALCLVPLGLTDVQAPQGAPTAPEAQLVEHRPSAAVRTVGGRRFDSGSDGSALPEAPRPPDASPPSKPAVPSGIREPIPSMPALTAEVGPDGAITGDANDVTYQGILAFAGESYGPRYLAIPEPVGTVARICGPADCVTRISTDFGPAKSMQREGRIADVSARDFERVCGMSPAQRVLVGLCPGSVTVERRVRVTPPATDSEGAG